LRCVGAIGRKKKFLEKKRKRALTVKRLGLLEIKLYLYDLWEFESRGHERETHAMIEKERERGVERTGGGG
jgi:hypothetical protein